MKLEVTCDPGVDVPRETHSSDWWVRSLLFDFFFYCKVGLRKGARGKDYRDLNWVHKELCDFLDPLITPHPQKLALMSRDMLKSTIGVRGFATNYILRKLAAGQPSKLFIFTGIFDLGQDHLENAVKILTESKLLQLHFSKILPQSKKDFDVLAMDKGKLRYRGIEIDIGSPEKSLTGHHYDGGINDNLVNEVNSQTEESKKKIVRRWRQQESILAEGAWEHVLETTWAPDDLAGMILDPEAEFDFSKLHRKPAYKFMSKTGYYVFSCPVRDQEGKPVFPEKLDNEYLARKRKKQGSYLYSALYDLQPVLEEEVEFRAKWIKHYAALPFPFIRNMCVDCAGTKANESSYSAISIGDWNSEGVLHIPFANKRKVSPRELIDWIVKLVEQSLDLERPIHILGIEREKFGIFLADVLDPNDFYKQYGVLVQLIPHMNLPRGVRISSLIPPYEFGEVVSAKGLRLYEREIKTYYKGKIKGTDILDTIWQHFRIKRVPKIKSKQPANLLYNSRPAPMADKDFIRQIEADSRDTVREKIASQF